MKKLFFVLLTLSLWSCSKDEEPIVPPNNVDQLVGTWTKISDEYTAFNGTITTNNVTGCQLQDKFIVKADGTFEEINFDLSLINNNCMQLTSGFTGSKIWLKATNGNYFFRKISTNPNYDTTFRIAESATFTGNQVKLLFTATESDPSEPFQTKTYVETYQKN